MFLRYKDFVLLLLLSVFCEYTHCIGFLHTGYKLIGDNGYICTYTTTTANQFTRCANENFYCPATRKCLPYSKRCTGESGGTDGATQCQSKDYKDCNYDSRSQKFQAYICSSDLDSSSSSSSRKRSFSDAYKCLKQKRVHQFITYRGLLYEFGKYGTRVQNPLDPNFEYRDGGRRFYGCKPVAKSSICTYEQIQEFAKDWVEYCLCGHNCQDYATGLATYIQGNCKKTNGRKREENSDYEFAEYIFSIAGNNCTGTLGNFHTEDSNTANSSGQSIVPLALGIAIMGIAVLIL